MSASVTALQVCALQNCLEAYRRGKLSGKVFASAVAQLLAGLSLSDLAREAERSPAKALEIAESLVQRYFTMVGEPLVTTINLSSLVEALRRSCKSLIQ